MSIGASTKIACLKVASRGDLLLAAPAFRALRETRSGAHLTLVVGRSCLDVATHLDSFDEIRTVDDSDLFSDRMADRARAALRLFWELRSGFDEIFIFHRDRRYALLALLAGIRVRRGLARGVDGRFLTHPFAPAPREHDSAQYMRMCGVHPDADRAGSIGSPGLVGCWTVRDGEVAGALACAEAEGFRLSGRPWVAFGFGGGKNVKTRTELKSWSPARYRALAEALAERDVGVVWLGDREDARVLGGNHVGVNLAGRLTVAESAAILARCDAAVANDTFLLHLSEAIGVPTIGLFGPTDPAQYGPQGPRSTSIWRGGALACSPCSRDGAVPPCPFGHRCMVELAVPDVLAALLPLLNGFQAPAGTIAHAG
jgi:ADP-heptose:LPS heptosyltransferase